MKRCSFGLFTCRHGSLITIKVCVDKRHLLTFAPRIAVSTHGVTQRRDECTHSGRRVQPLQVLQTGTSILTKSLSGIFSKDILWPQFCPGHHDVLTKVMITCITADFVPICHMGAGTSNFFWMSLMFIFVYLFKVQMKSKLLTQQSPIAAGFPAARP